MILLSVLFYRLGVSQGIDKYHKMCYTISGLVVADDMTGVYCRSAGVIPLDNIKEVVYNN